MKKFLSLVLVLSMIISCVSMVSFIVNAEEATASNESNSSGMEFSVVNTPVSGGYPVWQQAAGLTAENVADNKIALSFDVYNVGETATKFKLYIMNNNGGGTNLPSQSVKEIAKGQMIRVTMSIAINAETGKTTGGYTLANLMVRLQMESDSVNAGTKLLVVGNDALSVSVIQKLANVNVSVRGGATATDFSHKKWSGERPATGMEFSVVTAPSAGYPVWNGNAGLTQSDADTNNNIILSFDVYNVGDTDTKFEIFAQHTNWYTNTAKLPQSGTKEIAKGQMRRITLFIPTDGNGNAVGTSASTALSSVYIRFEMKSGSVNTGTKLLVVGNNAVSASVIQKATNISPQSGAAKTDFSCNTWIGERPTVDNDILTGMEFSVVTAPSAGYPIWYGNAGLTQSDADTNKNITLSFDVYNVGNTNTKFEVMAMDSAWSSTGLPKSGSKEIAKDEMIRVTLTIPTDGSGKAGTSSATALSSVYIRFEMKSGFVNAGTKLLVVGNNALSVSVIQKATSISAQSGAAKTDFSCNTWTGERPTMGMEFSVDTAPSAGYPIWWGMAGLTQSDADANKNITLSFDVYNVCNTNTKFEIFIKHSDRYTDNVGLPSSGSTDIARGEKITVTLTIATDGNGNATGKKGTTALSNIIIRFEMKDGYVNTGTKLLVVGNDALSASVIQKAKTVSPMNTNSTGGFSSNIWTGERPAPIETEIKGANLEIGSTLTVNYYATLAVGCDEAEMVFTRNGKTDRVKGVVQADGTFKFAYTGINPQCMGDNIAAELVLGDDVLDSYEEYSIKQYALNKYNAEATDEKAQALNTLLADMLAYGAASQIKTGYKDDQLVNVDITWPTSEFEAPTKTDKSVDKNDNSEARVTSIGLNISNVYKIYFRLNITADNVVVKLNGDAVTVNDEGIIYTDDIKATGNADIYTLEIFKDDVSVSTVTYSVNSYIYAKHDAQDVGYIVQAISNYGKAAENYASFK